MFIYFQHSFGGSVHGPPQSFADNGCYQPMIDTITAVNAQIKAIAPRAQRAER